MSQPYVGEIRMFGGNFAPAGWMFCDGQLLSIAENEVLFALIGTTYGGDGENTFALPDLRGRIPIHQGTHNGMDYAMGEGSGQENVQIELDQLPAHTHTLMANDGTAESENPSGALPSHASRRTYGPPSQLSQMAANAVENTGGSQPHSNMQPYLCVSFIISLFGIFPSQT
jgi:microcystin-dependent protein